MRYALLILVLLSACTSTHRLVLVYEAGDAVKPGGSQVLVNTKGETDD